MLFPADARHLHEALRPQLFADGEPVRPLPDVDKPIQVVLEELHYRIGVVQSRHQCWVQGELLRGSGVGAGRRAGLRQHHRYQRLRELHGHHRGRGWRQQEFCGGW